MTRCGFNDTGYVIDISYTDVTSCTNHTIIWSGELVRLVEH